MRHQCGKERLTRVLTSMQTPTRLHHLITMLCQPSETVYQSIRKSLITSYDANCRSFLCLDAHAGGPQQPATRQPCRPRELPPPPLEH
jgi:hypothetical protein